MGKKRFHLSVSHVVSSSFSSYLLAFLRYYSAGLFCRHTHETCLRCQTLFRCCCPLSSSTSLIRAEGYVRKQANMVSKCLDSLFPIRLFYLTSLRIWLFFFASTHFVRFKTQLSSLSPGTLDHFFFSCRLCCLIPRSRIPSMKHWVPFFVSFLSLSPQLLNGFKRKRNWPFMILSIMHSLFSLYVSFSSAPWTC